MPSLNSGNAPRRSRAANQYAGFHPDDPSWTPERVNAADMAPADFYARFVATRTPVVLTGAAEAPDDSVLAFARPAVERWKDLAYFRRLAGKRRVLVEERRPQDASFGLGGPRRSMEVGALLDEFAAGPAADRLYLTTQYDAGAAPRLLQEPLPALERDIVRVPGLTPTLVTQQLTLWLGRCSAPGGRSSGLHHDHADNLFVLVRGRKRFTLFSPRDALLLSTHGAISRVFENGLVVYDGAQVRGDGALLDDVREWAASRPGKRTRCDEGEFGDSASDASWGNPSDADSVDWNAPDDYCESDDEKSSSQAEETRSEFPPSFSRIPPAELQAYCKARIAAPESAPPPPANFPALAQTTPVQLQLGPGDILYLPAGWFHEVTSFGGSGGSGDSGDSCGVDAIHMGFNYWLHPPVNAQFDAPYSDGYWESLRPTECSSGAQRDIA